MTKTKLPWLPAKDLRRLLRQAGIGDSNLLAVIAWACLSRGLIATGFGWSLKEDCRQNLCNERDHVRRTLWRVFERVDPAFDRVSDETKAHFETMADWDAGEFTWSLNHPDKGWIQETWASVHFDRVSAESLCLALDERTKSNTMQDFEIEAWIRDTCQTENSKTAWTDFKAAYGNRTGKRNPTFRDAWVKVKGNRTRGRLRNQHE